MFWLFLVAFFVCIFHCVQLSPCFIIFSTSASAPPTPTCSPFLLVSDSATYLLSPSLFSPSAFIHLQTACLFSLCIQIYFCLIAAMSACLF